MPLVECTLCFSPLTDFSLCTACGKGFCKAHDYRLCPFCNRETVRASTKQVKARNDLPVTWILAKGAKVGLFGFEKLPLIASIALVFLSERGQESNFDIVVFPDRRATDEFQKSFPRQMSPGRQTPETHPGSRYSFMLDQEKRTATVFLNNSAIAPKAVQLALALTSRIFKSFPVDLRENAEIVGMSLFEILKKYNAHFGIPFFSISEYPAELLVTLSQNLHYDYCYYQAAKSVVSENNLTEAADFLQERMDIVPKLIDWGAIDLFGEVLGVLWRYAESLSIVQCVSHVPVLQQLLRERHVKNVAEMKNHLRNYPDVTKAIDVLGQLLDRDDHYASREEFFNARCNALVRASDFLEPRYFWPFESVELLKMSEKCQEAIETDRELAIPGIGSYPEVMALLEGIFEKTNVYPEVPILAGMALFQILVSLIQAKRDYIAYRKGLDFGRRLVTKIEESLEEIQKKNPRVGDDPGSSVTEEQLIHPLLTLAWAARSFNETEEARRLEREAAGLLEKHSVPYLRMLMNWRAFMESHDLDHLGQIYQEFQTSLIHSENEYESLAKIAGHLASAFFDESKRDLHLREARDLALNYEISVGISISNSAGRNFTAISVHLLDLIGAVFDLELHGMSANAVKKAVAASRIILEDASMISPVRSIALKTMCLCSLLQRDVTGLRSNLALLATCSTSPRLESYVDLCNIWLIPGGIKHRLARLLRTRYDARDPWNSTVVQFLNSEVNVQLERAEILDCDAVIFVEGKDDVGIFHQWARKLLPDGKILLIRADGWTNFQYFANARLAAELRRPPFVIFDGDTDMARAKSVKDKLVQGLIIPPERIITLSRNSVESYLLVARPIKSAFRRIRISEGNLASFLVRMSSKRNKKGILETLFRQHLNVRYDGEAGARIASHMRINEIDDEIHSVFLKIKHEVLSYPAGPNFHRQVVRQDTSSLALKAE